LKVLQTFIVVLEAFLGFLVFDLREREREKWKLFVVIWQQVNGSVDP
jgi:hypothetical protein